MGVVEYMGRWRMFKPEGTAAMYKGVAALIHQELGELRKLPFLERKVREVGGRGSQVRLAGPQGYTRAQIQSLLIKKNIGFPMTLDAS